MADRVIIFTTRLEKTPGQGGWHFVRLSDEVRTQLRELSGRNGNVPVRMTIGKTSWPSTTMSMGKQQWFVAVKATVRQAESIVEGDSVTVKIAPDVERSTKTK